MGRIYPTLPYHHPLPPPRSGGHCRRRYASYGNALTCASVVIYSRKGTMYHVYLVSLPDFQHLTNSMPGLNDFPMVPIHVSDE